MASKSGKNGTSQVLGRISAEALTRGERVHFNRIPEVMEMPYLLETQKNSYRDFLQYERSPDQRLNQGLQEAYQSVFPIATPGNPSSLEFVEYTFGQPKYSVSECIERGMTYAAPLKVRMQLIVRELNEETTEVEIKDIKEQETFMGEIPLMTEQGTFIINGAERVIVSQLHRSPGISFSSATHPNGKETYLARIIPYRGAWVEFEVDIYNVMHVMIDRKRKIPATTFLRAFGFDSDAEIAEHFFELETVELDDFAAGATRHDDLLNHLGAEFIEDVQDEKGKRLAERGAKVTKKMIEALRVAGVEKVHLSVADAYGHVLGRILGADVVDLATGEIVAECWEQITTSLLRRCSLCKVRELTCITTRSEENNVILNTLEKERAKTQEDALIEFFKKMRPGNPVSVPNGRRLLDDMFHNERRYDLGAVGRYKINNRFYRRAGETPQESRLLAKPDLIHVMKHLAKLANGQEEVDDIDHLGNRRVRSVGELLQNQIRVGLAEMEKTARERMSVVELENLLPHNLINAKPVISAIKDFFGRSQLSQFMDQTNPLAELTHKRRLSALGPGGLSRDRAGFEVRDVHHTHYGRICPIETPEGPNIGLISSLATYARINEYGFIETPYRKVEDSKVSKNFEYLTADIEDDYIIAQANAPLKDEGHFVNNEVLCRWRADYPKVEPGRVNYMDVSPKQLVSVSASLIPFLEHDDANRALMGSNMQRQAVPLISTDSPVVGTGVEAKVAVDSGVCVLARNAGSVQRVTAREIIVKNELGENDYYRLRKFVRSNQNTCINQVPIVNVGDEVEAGSVLADGPGTQNGELALGKNVLVAFMPWGGYNFEDSILLSERMVSDDVYSSVHIEMYDVDARDTKLGKEEITRDIPNVSEEALAKLDENGLVYIGAEVEPGDILVGKVTPKGETELTSEEKLLRAIFGEKAGDVRDASLTVPPGTRGTVVDIKVFSRKERGSKLEEKAEKDQISEIDRELDIERDGLRTAFLEELRPLVDEIDKPVINYETGKPEFKPGQKVDKKVLEFIFSSLKTGMLPAEGDVGQRIKRAWQVYQARVIKAEDIARNRVDRIKTGDELPPGVIKLVKVYLAQKRKIQVGDKMAGRHGNKGVVSKILPVEDMPFLEDGTPVDIVLNPLGVPSRMNIGQLLETHLGWAAGKLGLKVATHVFDGLSEEGIKGLLSQAGLPDSGQARLIDGRTGDIFDNPVTVGIIYMLKLAHLVDDKMHARSIGPYSLVTQQPLGGKAQFGGQRLGEMEVWALEAYGAAYTLQELLTVKSDDVVGRTKIYESIVKGDAALTPGIPESFNVLVKELQGLALNLELLTDQEIELVEEKPRDEDLAQNFGRLRRFQDDEIAEREDFPV
jgi:DNA-directed RNA polymerase subunit beta